MADYYRPNFFVNTPDINPYYLQTSGRAGLHRARDARGDAVGHLGHVHRLRDLRGGAAAGPRGISRFREVRDSSAGFRPARQHQGSHPPPQPHPQQPSGAADAPQHHLPQRMERPHHRLRTHVAPRARRSSSCSSTSIPHHRQECTYEVPLWEFGLPDNASIEVEDLLCGGRFTLLRQDPPDRARSRHNPAIIWRLITPAQGRAP